MHIGLRMIFGIFLIVGLTALITLRVFVQEVKPGVREAMEDTVVDTAQVLATLAADDMANWQIADGAFARQLEKLRENPVSANVWGMHKNPIGYRINISDAHGIVRYDSAGGAVGQDYSRWSDVYRTLRNEYGARSTRTDPNDDSSTVMHVVVPIRHGNMVIGVLTIAKLNQTVAPFIARSQRKILLYGALLIGVACMWWLVLGLRRLGVRSRPASAQRCSWRVRTNWPNSAERSKRCTRVWKTDSTSKPTSTRSRMK